MRASGFVGVVMRMVAVLMWTDTGPKMGADTPGTPGSQGLSGPQSSKKQKSLRQAETNSEAVQAGPQAGSALGASKLLRQNSMRDRNRRVRPATKVRSWMIRCRAGAVVGRCWYDGSGDGMWGDLREWVVESHLRGREGGVARRGGGTCE